MDGSLPQADDRDDPAILVTAYSARYAAAARKLLVTEGGLADDPADHGGTTKYGVSLRFLMAEGKIDLDGDGFADFDLDFDGDIDGADVRKLSRGDAVYLYHRCFWQRLDAESFAAPIGEMLFDQAVNGGITAARKLLQRAINACLAKAPQARTLPAPLKIDGGIGKLTLAAMLWVIGYPGLGMPALIAAFREAAADRYRAIAKADPTQKGFLKGWLRRAAALGK
jgi:lysozyme family protein